MYGTIARLQLQPGKEEALGQMLSEFESADVPGFIAEYLYRSDEDSDVWWMAALFTDRAAYEANAHSPEQHARYLKFRALLSADPEWHDGEVVHSTAGDGPARQTQPPRDL